MQWTDQSVIHISKLFDISVFLTNIENVDIFDSFVPSDLIDNPGAQEKMSEYVAYLKDPAHLMDAIVELIYVERRPILILHNCKVFYDSM